MQSSRLKNIIILILALVNIFLLGSLSVRKNAQLETRRQVQEQLVALFSASDLTLDPKAVSFQTPPSGGTLTRDADQERQLAAALLGKGLSHSSQSGVIYSYESDAGAAVFSAGGSFDAAVLLENGTDAERFCRKICKQFQYDSFTAANEYGQFTAGAVRSFDSYPVPNCTISFALQGDTLTVSGTFLPSAFSAAGEEEPLSAAAALTAFLGSHRESGAVVSAVTDMYPCYTVQSTSAAAMTLTPTWCICTDFGLYYVNCYTGAVTRG